MKEQYNNFQKRLEEIPRLKPEAHFVINDVAQKILTNQPLVASEQDSIEAIVFELQNLDREIVDYILNLKYKEVITIDECNLAASYLLATKQIGPNSDEIRNVFYQVTMDITQFEKLLKSVSLPEYSRSILLNIYRKIIEKNNKI